MPWFWSDFYLRIVDNKVVYIIVIDYIGHFTLQEMILNQIYIIVNPFIPSIFADLLFSLSIDYLLAFFYRLPIIFSFRFLVKINISLVIVLLTLLILEHLITK